MFLRSIWSDPVEEKKIKLFKLFKPDPDIK